MNTIPLYGKKRGSRGVRIFLIFIIISLIDEIAPGVKGMGTVVFWVVVVGLILKSALSKKSTGGQTGIEALENIVKKHTSSPISTKETQRNKEERQKVKEAKKRDTAMKKSLEGHTSSDTTEKNVSHNYTYKELSQNYNVAKYIKHDDLGASQTNPFSLDGK